MEQFGLKYKEYSNIHQFQFETKSLNCHDGGVFIEDLSKRIKSTMSVHYSGMNGTIPIKQHTFKVDLSVFKLPEFKRYHICDIEEDFIEIHLYDYMDISYEWKENTISTSTYSIFSENNTKERSKKFKDQREGVAYAYDLFEHYKQKFPELMMEMLL